MKTNNWLVCPIFAFVTPLFLWPIELLLPFPFIIEELAKTALVLFAWPKSSKTDRFQLAITIGLCFTLSESVLYFFNLTSLDSSSSFLLRILFTGVMHTLTTVLITFSRPLGLPAAMLIHYLYNSVFSSL